MAAIVEIALLSDWF